MPDTVETDNETAAPPEAAYDGWAIVEHLHEAERLIRRAYLVGEQARLNRARADTLAGGIERAAA